MITIDKGLVINKPIASATSFILFFLANPKGLEPITSESESDVLPIELQVNKLTHLNNAQQSYLFKCRLTTHASNWMFCPE